MPNDTASVGMKASSGVHEQIEGFLQTVMRGLMRQRTQNAEVEQLGKLGRPVNLPSVSLWMAVLVAILRGLCVSTGHLEIVSSRRLVEPAKL